MKKSSSPTSLKPPSTSMIMKIITQPPSQQKCTQFWPHPLVDTPNHAPATCNKIHIPMIPATLATHNATNHPNPSPQTNQFQAITAHSSTPHPTTFDSSHHHQPQPTNQHTVCPSNTQQTDPLTCSTNYTNGDCSTSSPCPTKLHNETINPAPVLQCKHHQSPPTTMPKPVFNCAPYSLFSKDHLNPIMALKEAVFNLNEAFNRLCTAITPMPNIVRYDDSTTKSFPSTLYFPTRNTPYTTNTYDTIQPCPLLVDLYDLMMIALPTTYDRLTHLPQELHQTLAVMPCQMITHSSHTVQFYTDSYCNPSTLQMHLRQSTKYTKDLWQPP